MRMNFSVSLDGLPSFATAFWNYVGDRKVFLFFSEMGSGKTTIIEALCLAKGIKERMGSPTFSIINQYGYEEGGAGKTIYHIDLYRLKDEEEIIQAGVEDCIYSGAICFVEWPQKASPDLYDEATVSIFIEAIDTMHRSIQINLPAAE